MDGFELTATDLQLDNPIEPGSIIAIKRPVKVSRTLLVLPVQNVSREDTIIAKTTTVPQDPKLVKLDGTLCIRAISLATRFRVVNKTFRLIRVSICC